MKNNRTPVITDVLYSQQWFLLVLAVCVIISDRHFGDPAVLGMKALPCAAAYAVIALTVRLTGSPVLRLLIPAAAVAGCTLLGQTPAERIILCAAGLGAVGVGLIVHFSIRKGTSPYNVMFVFVFALGLLTAAAEWAQWELTLPWLRIISALYLPLCAAVWYINKLSDSMSLFGERADQPAALIKKRMSSTITTAVMLVMLAMLILPQSDGGSLLSAVFRAALKALVWIIVFLTRLFPIFYGSEEIIERQDAELQAVIDSSDGSMWGIYIVYFASAALFVFIIGWLIASAVRLVKTIAEDFLRFGEIREEKEALETDTVEKLERRHSGSESRRERRSNAAKVRKIYRRRVASIIGSEIDSLQSLAPDEIAEKCSEKGEDITGLTLLYKKARYTNSCTADDVKAARGL